ncbi:hypothetical protein EAN04_24630 [Salmonella enterica]|nr:hypothetical protein [Salmonella enterica]
MPRRKIEKTKDIAAMEIREAARLRWTSHPDLTHADVAKEFGLVITTVQYWSSRYQWKKTKARPAPGTPVRLRQIIKKAIEDNGLKPLTNEQIDELMREEYKRQRDSIIHKHMIELRQLCERLDKVMVTDSPRAERLYTAIEKKLKVMAEERRLWRIDEFEPPVLLPADAMENIINELTQA